MGITVVVNMCDSGLVIVVHACHVNLVCMYGGVVVRCAGGAVHITGFVVGAVVRFMASMVLVCMYSMVSGWTSVVVMQCDFMVVRSGHSFCVVQNVAGTS